MAHQSLYRTYRPQTFSDVVGQEHIERTLRNAVAEGTVAHAYLFCGPRGTGKTTTARILAKALNCEKGPTPTPDGTCQDCIEIAEGRHPDVYELDAASRTGVDNVRDEIIGRVQFAPTRGHYKVYIIDEVHMLSTAAFNALLKTLEEPPSHVVFVLATTHPQKVPETIQSRCQRFDFHRIPVEAIADRLRVISDGEGFSVPDAALALIGRHAAGGMRDAITTLEQLAAFTAGTITLEDVEGLLGEVDSAQLFEIAELIARRDVASCFRWVATFVEHGTDLAEFVRELTAHFRNLYIASAVGTAPGIIDVAEEESVRLAEQAAAFGGSDRLMRILSLLGELGAEMRWSSDARLSLEVAFARMARPGGEVTLEALAERIEALEKGAPAVAATPTATPTTVAAAPATAPTATPQAAGARQSASAPTAAPAASVAPSPAKPAAPKPARVGELNRASARHAWPDVVAAVRQRKAARAHILEEADLDVDPDGTLVLGFPASQAFSKQLAEEPEMRELLKEALVAVVGFAPAIRTQVLGGAVGALSSAPAAPAAAPAPAAPASAPVPTPAPAPQPCRGDASETADATSEEVDIDVERFLMESLGAKVVAQHGGPEPEPEGEDPPAEGPVDYGYETLSLGDTLLEPDEENEA
ncbi:MAG: DNA polymerase III subunit gamma/tau [Coriobacteriia bacterium]